MIQRLDFRRRCASLVITAVLVVSGCTSTTGEPTPAVPADPGNADTRSRVRPKVADIGEIAVAVPAALGDYHAVAGEDILSLVLPSPYTTDHVDGRDTTAVDGDVMDGVRVIGADPQTVEYRFKPEAVWSDGAPIGCADVRLRWLTATSLLTEADARRMFGGRVAGYQRVRNVNCGNDGRSATVVFAEPYADFRGLFDRLLPAHVLSAAIGAPELSGLTPEQKTAAARFHQESWRGFQPAVALSGGPYLITGSDREHTTLVRNPRWWGHPGGPSKIVVWARDTPAAIRMLRAGEVVAIQVEPDPTTAAALRADPALAVVSRAGGRFEHLDFNQDSPTLAASPELRQAIVACVNRQSLVDKLAKDRNPEATPLGSVLFLPGETGYRDHYAALSGQTGRARKILEDQGWALAADGVYGRDGRRASVRIGYRPTPGRARIVELIRQDCAQAGVDIVDAPSAEFDAAPGRGDWDTALLTGTSTATKSAALGPPGVRGGTAEVIIDEAVAELARRAGTELDATRRIAALDAVDGAIAARSRTLPLYSVPAFVVHLPGYSGIGYLPEHGGLLRNAHSWQRG